MVPVGLALLWGAAHNQEAVGSPGVQSPHLLPLGCRHLAIVTAPRMSQTQNPTEATAALSSGSPLGQGLCSQLCTHQPLTSDGDVPLGVATTS